MRFWLCNSSWLWVIDLKVNEAHIPRHYGKHSVLRLECSIDNVCRVYAILAIYLLVCSFALTVKAFMVCSMSCQNINSELFTMRFQNIPNELKGESASQVVASFFKPPIGALIAAMVSTYGVLDLFCSCTPV